MHVAEVRHELVGDGAERSTLERVDRRQQRMDGAVEVADLAAQEVDPLGRCGRAREHGLLDLLDVPLEAFDHRRVVVDDLVEDRPEHRVGTGSQEILVLLEAQAGRVELAGHSLPHRDHEARAEEDGDLAELDLLALVDVVRGAQDDEPHVVVALELRSQMERLRVLHGELVEAEALANLLELLGLPVFLLGRGVRGGFHGAEPSLTDLDDGDLKHGTDFRAVYASVLDRVLGMDPGRVLDGWSERVDGLLA